VDDGGMLTAQVPTALLAHAGHVHQGGGSGLPALVLVALPFLAGAALTGRSRDAVAWTVVLFSAAAGFVHAVVTPEHFQEGAAAGLFTLAVTLGQMLVVVAGLNWPSRKLWRWSAVANAAVVVIWVASRTTGVPIGPAPWTAEPAGLLDVACSAYELAIVAGCVAMTRTPNTVSLRPACQAG
jgi:hypothetical protein